MVIDNLLVIIRNITFQVSILLFAIVLAFLFFSFGVHFFKEVFVRFKSLYKKRIYDTLYKYLLYEVSTDHIIYKRSQRDTLIEAFSTIISLIIGERREHLKRGVIELGLIESLERGLFSFFPSKRMHSCHTLGIVGSRESASLITRSIFDRNPRVTSSAIIALGELKNEKVVPSLLEYYKVCPLSHGWLIASILPFFGTSVHPQISHYLREQSLHPKKLILLIKAIAILKFTDSLEDLKNLIVKSNNLDVRLNALTAIGEIRDLYAVKIVVDTLSDKEWQARAIACNLIGEMSIKGAAYRLIPMLGDRNWHVRKNAASALVKLGKIGIAALLVSLDTDDRYARDMIVQTLEESGIVENAIAQLKSDVTAAQKEGAQIINALINKGYKEYLKNFLDTSPALETIMNRGRDG